MICPGCLNAVAERSPGAELVGPASIRWTWHGEACFSKGWCCCLLHADHESLLGAAERAILMASGTGTLGEEVCGSGVNSGARDL